MEQTTEGHKNSTIKFFGENWCYLNRGNTKVFLHPL
nr:MAG TPA: putative dioxygenase [Caudoviricetes sp.]